MRKTILNDLKQEMIDEIQTGNANYDIGAGEMYRGLYQWSDIASKPALCFTCYGDNLIREYAGYETRELLLLVYGFTETTGDLHTLAKDVEYFFLNDYSLKDDVVMGNISLREGQERETFECIFDTEIKVRYTQKINII